MSAAPAGQERVPLAAPEVAAHDPSADREHPGHERERGCDEGRDDSQDAAHGSKHQQWNRPPLLAATTRRRGAGRRSASRHLDAAQIRPQVTWGTSPEMVLSIEDRVPDPEREKDAGRRSAMERALQYMALEPNKSISDIHVDKVFIGSCTNSRIEDMRAAAEVVKRVGGRIASNVKLALVVPGSGLVKEQAEREGLDKIFIAADFEWREPGCSMCLAMNADRLEPGERCASTSNRNFEGRQGAGGRTHLVSPAMAAAAAMQGHFVDVRRIA